MKQHFTLTSTQCKTKLIFLFLFFLSLSDGFSQSDSIKPPPKPDKPLKYNLNDEGSHFFQVTFLNQTWVRLNESNPGTVVLNDPASKTFDIGLRRTRIQMFGQITDRAFLYFQFGLNNFNYLNGFSTSTNRKVQAFFHDALGEYRVTKGNQLKLGGGLTIANGLSRFSQPSVSTILAVDVPIFAQATVDQTDEFSRKLSIYARGQISKVDYRLVVSDPFPIQTNANNAVASLDKNGYATFAGTKHHKQYQGYIAYQFYDHEQHLTPYMTGSYLGTKKVLNIAGGLIYQKNAMWKYGDVNRKDTIHQDMLLWCLEGFLDLPLNKERGTALTAYLGYFNYNFGTNYIRTQAQMNPATGISLPAGSPYIGSVSGSGNGWPMMGTGNIIYTQAGYLLPKNLLGNLGSLQPYFTYQLNDFTRLNDKVHVFDLGINLLFNGHRSKLSFDYQNRPVFNNINFATERRGSYILQYQIAI